MHLVNWFNFQKFFKSFSNVIKVGSKILLLKFIMNLFSYVDGYELCVSSKIAEWKLLLSCPVLYLRINFLQGIENLDVITQRNDGREIRIKSPWENSPRLVARHCTLYTNIHVQCTYFSYLWIFSWVFSLSLNLHV